MPAVQLTIITGRHFRPMTIVVTGDIDFDDEQTLLNRVFHACNRIEYTLEDDLRSLIDGWQRLVRRQLDYLDAASMVVGDTVEIKYATDRTTSRRYECLPVGWQLIPDEDQ
jgi:hypothetical protein